MRDDFNESIKITLSHRVGSCCSNPDCQRPTRGPNTNPHKSTNIGVAAHITAASPGGPRFNNALTSQQRGSTENGIWLCQACAKLIDSDVTKYSVEVLNSWKREAEERARLSLNQTTQKSNRYQYIVKLMPELLKKMAEDLTNYPLAREFVLFSRKWTYGGKTDALFYFIEEYDQLEQKITILERNGLVEDITYNSTKRYLFTEDFVEYLQSIN